jgi:hypothetical protein
LDTKTVIRVAESFLNSLTALKEESSRYQTCVSGAVNIAKQKLSVDGDKDGGKDADKKPRVKLSSVAEAWETEWKKVDAQTANLEKQFKAIAPAAEVYWAKLDEVTNGINDPKLLERQTAKVKVAKDKWELAYKNAEKQIEKAKALRTKGQDLHRVMLSQAFLKEIEGFTSDLNSIAEEAANLLKELELVTEQGKLIIN